MQVEIIASIYIIDIIVCTTIIACLLSNQRLLTSCSLQAIHNGISVQPNNMAPWDARVETSDIMFPKKLRDFQSETTLLSNFQLCIKLGKTSRSVSIKGVCSLHIPIERGIHHVSCLVMLAGYLGVSWLAQRAATFLLTTMPTKNGKI